MLWSLERFQHSGHTHFITFSCYDRQPKLANPAACDIFLHVLEVTRKRFAIRIYGYVLMPEHVHLLMSEPECSTFAVAIRSLKVTTAKQFHASSDGSDSPFWQARYYDRNIRDYDEFVLKLRYLHRNPVKRGLCRSPEEWPWSSFPHYRTGEAGVGQIESDGTARVRDKQTTPRQRR